MTSTNPPASLAAGSEKAESISDPADARRDLLRRELALFAFVAVTIAVLYSLITDHVWEDYFITFRHSRNLAEGNGLVYQPGERVHGFTSPLGTLLPAFLFWILRSDSYVPTLWLFRLLSIAAFAGGGLFVFKTFQQEDDGGNRLA